MNKPQRPVSPAAFQPYAGRRAPHPSRPPMSSVPRVAAIQRATAPLSPVIQRAALRVDPEWKEVVSDKSSHGGEHAHVVAAATTVTKKLDIAFANPEHVRLPRSFREQPVRQVLRWLATYILAKFPSGVEIQCYFHNGTIFVSSNKDSVNTSIALSVKEGRLLPTSVSSGNVPQERVPRHTWKLSRPPTSPEEEAVKKILAKAGITVIPKYDYGCDFHAERRIAHYLNIDKPNPNFLAGTRRACMACAAKLQLSNSSHPGLLYTSKAGLGVDDVSKKAAMAAEIKAYAEAHSLLSYVSRDRYTREIDENHDTDSEDDS